MSPTVRKILSYLVVIAVLALVGWLALREPAQLARVHEVGHGPLTQQFTEEGKTRVKARYVVAAPLAGQLRRIELQAGDQVEAGQTVALIDPVASGLLDARARAQAEADVRSGLSQQTAARQRVASALAAHRLAQTSLKRAITLHRSDSIAQETLDQARSTAHTRRAELAAARAEESAAAERVQSARAVLMQEGRDTQSEGPFAVRAPTHGVVLAREQESSLPVTAGQALMTLGDPASLELVAEVLSTDAVRLRPGMRANVIRWGGSTLEATVRRIEPGAFTKTSALGVEEQRTRVVLDLVSPLQQWQTLGDAYRVEIEFILQHRDNALQVPLGALFRTQARQSDDQADAGSGWALYLVENERARLRPVKIGLRSPTAVEILSGVEEGDRVILQPDDRIQDGTRIQPE